MCLEEKKKGKKGKNIYICGTCVEDKKRGKEKDKKKKKKGKGNGITIFSQYFHNKF